MRPFEGAACDRRDDRKQIHALRICKFKPRYFFRIHNDMDTIDEEGIELPDGDGARVRGQHEVRKLATESIKTEGHLVLDHHIEIVDEAGERSQRPGLRMRSRSDAKSNAPA